MENKKIVLVGDGRVGKSSILTAISKRTFNKEYEPTLFDTQQIGIEVNEKSYLLTVWDTNGLEFDSLRSSMYLDTDLFFICYAVDDVDSYRNASEKWVNEIKPHLLSHSSFIFVATKVDLMTSPDAPSSSSPNDDDDDDLPPLLSLNFLFEDCDRDDNFEISSNEVNIENDNNNINNDNEDDVKNETSENDLKSEEKKEYVNIEKAEMMSKEKGAKGHYECSSLSAIGVYSLFVKAISHLPPSPPSPLSHPLPAHSLTRLRKKSSSYIESSDRPRFPLFPSLSETNLKLGFKRQFSEKDLFRSPLSKRSSQNKDLQKEIQRDQPIGDSHRDLPPPLRDHHRERCQSFSSPLTSNSSSPSSPSPSSSSTSSPSSSRRSSPLLRLNKAKSFQILQNCKQNFLNKFSKNTV